MSKAFEQYSNGVLAVKILRFTFVSVGNNVARYGAFLLCLTNFNNVYFIISLL